MEGMRIMYRAFFDNYTAENDSKLSDNIKTMAFNNDIRNILCNMPLIIVNYYAIINNKRYL